MKLKNKILSYRFLTTDDLPIYIDFYQTMKTMLKVAIAQVQIDRAILNYSNINRKNVGAFDQDNKLVAVVSGHFYPNFPVWYCNNQYVKQENDSLSSYLEYIQIHTNSMKLLTDHGEENEYYSFYARRSLTHQASHEKLLKIAVKRGVIEDTRYDYLYETIYDPLTTTTDKINHKFFFPETVEISIDTASIIVLYSLKQQYRKELLVNRYPNYFLS